MSRIMLLCLTILLAAAQALPQPAPKTTLGLMDLSCSGLSPSEGLLLSDRLLLEVANTGKFDVVERSKRDTILKEHSYAQSGACDQTTCLIEAGKLLAVQKMLGGSVGRFGSTWTMNIRMVDVNTGKVERAFIRDFKGEMDGLLSSMKDVAQALALPPEQQNAIKQRVVADSLEAEAHRKAKRDSLLAAQTVAQRREEVRKPVVRKAVKSNFLEVVAGYYRPNNLQDKEVTIFNAAGIASSFVYEGRAGNFWGFGYGRYLREWLNGSLQIDYINNMYRAPFTCYDSTGTAYSPALTLDCFPLTVGVSVLLPMHLVRPYLDGRLGYGWINVKASPETFTYYDNTGGTRQIHTGNLSGFVMRAGVGTQVVPLKTLALDFGAYYDNNLINKSNSMVIFKSGKSGFLINAKVGFVF